MRKVLCFVLFLSLFLAGAAQTDCAGRIVPQVQKETKEGGELLILSSEQTFYTNLKGRERKEFLSYLKDSPLHLKKISRNAAVNFLINEKRNYANDEAYALTVGNKIYVEARTPAGLFYGFQSLLQLAKPFKNLGFSFPKVSIEDYPRFAWRGMHLDVSRHFFSKEFVKKQLDAMARYKLNTFHWHLTDGAGWRIEIKKYPELTKKTAYRPYPNWKEFWNTDRKFCAAGDSAAQGGFYTQKDIKEVVEYARKLHITVIPEIEMPGHSEEVFCAYPQFTCSPEAGRGGVFCPGREETFTFLQDVLDEVMKLFPSKFIHVGGDEVDYSYWKKCSRCQAKMKELGFTKEKDLQGYLISRIGKYLESHGRHLLGWDEILDSDQSPEAGVMIWRDENKEREVLKSGHPVIMTPGRYCYLDAFQDAPVSQPEAIGGYLPLDLVYSYDPVPEGLTPAEEKLVLGVQGNLWTEYIPSPEHAEYMIYPRILAVAEVGWTNPSMKNWKCFREAVVKETDCLKENGYHPFDIRNEVGERPLAKTEVKHLARGKKVKYISGYADWYRANGDASLTDGICGGWTYGDKKWQGFLNKDFEVVVDMEKETEIHSVKINFMQVQGAEVWLPEKVEFYISEDGVNFRLLSSEGTSPEVLKNSRYALKEYVWSGEAKARYIKVKGLKFENKEWLFTDEIIVD